MQQQLRSAGSDLRVANMQQFPGSRKIYRAGSNGIRVPMREISLAATASLSGGPEPNAPVVVYDTSGPYTDPDIAIDLSEGLPELRSPWILSRGEYDRGRPSYRPVPGHSDRIRRCPGADRHCAAAFASRRCTMPGKAS
jgi:phosphomethylpyrimidine synthase